MTIRIIENWNDEVNAWVDRLNDFGSSLVHNWLTVETSEYRTRLGQELALAEINVDTLLGRIQSLLDARGLEANRKVYLKLPNLKLFYLLEWFSSSLHEEPKVWGPFEKDSELDNQVTMGLIEDSGKRLLMAELNTITGELHVWEPSIGKRDDLLKAVDAIPSETYTEATPPKSELTHRERTAFNSLLRQRRAEEGQDDA